MAGPDYGALGATFKIVRALQVICLLSCIGMAANFISEMVTNSDTPSNELVGTLSVVGSFPMSESGKRKAALTVSNRLASPFSTVQLLTSSTSTTSFRIY